MTMLNLILGSLFSVSQCQTVNICELVCHTNTRFHIKADLFCATSASFNEESECVELYSE